MVTDALGLVTLLIAGLSALAVVDADLSRLVGTSAPMLIVLGSLLIGGITGSVLRLEQRVEAFGAGCSAGSRATRARSNGTGSSRASSAASLLFCTGPLTILGSLQDGLGNGADQLVLKAVLDGFAAIAFAASFVGRGASALTVLVVQGSLTVVGFLLGDVLPAAHVAALTATGGLLLVGVALRLLRIREILVADLLPALLVAPALVQFAAAIQ